ncbi:uncharacterized protein LOC21396225 isoform X2 [Morus notabilis]|uniref:uncharacterized protein LOC21396225 isoform X2 n=1 Tax=Morus notabilis TaxID=981085 RepID=UPI000CED3583|nr:uncharacterized protein LOC21396225 isoform X2 [Morus notabilis]
MATYKLDPDVERWGLHLLDVCTLANDTSRSTVTGYDADVSKVEYVREGYVVEPCNVENDEVIAYAYQEELSRLASAEASGRPDFDEEHYQASIIAQDWLGPSKRHGNENGWKMENGHDSKGTMEDHSNREIPTDDYTENKDGDDSSRIINEEAQNYQMPTVFTYPIPDESRGENLTDAEEWLHELDITDESSLDSEVGRRLNQMVPVPHVPRTIEKVPSVDEEISDHERLLERLQLYDLVERRVQGDGNCQFRALSDQLYRSAEHHGFVRQQIVEQYGVKVFVITSFKDTCSIEILPHAQKSNRVIFLSFWAEVHYNSIYPEGEFPASCTRKKKKWWNIIN